MQTEKALADVRKYTGIHKNTDFQYFGLGGVRLRANYSQIVWDKILDLILKNYDFEEKWRKELRKVKFLLDIIVNMLFANTLISLQHFTNSSLFLSST